MADLITMLSAVAGQQGEEVDEDFNQTVLLLHGDGTNGAQNNTFLDSSTNNFTITRNGNTTQGTFSPFSVGAGEWSNYFDGNGDYLQCNQALDGLTSSSDPFTVECWFYSAVMPTSDFETIIGINSTSGASNQLLLSVLNNSLGIHYATASVVYSGTVYAGSWNHVAGVFDGTDFKVYLNGSLVHTVSSTSPTIALSTAAFYLGTEIDLGPVFGNYFNGYISNVRVTESAVYSANFTPSTAPLTAISGTSLLTCQSNRFVDNSTNAFAITRNGDVKVTPFSPFAPTAAYSAGTNGGSGYFDGTGDYLSVADAAGLEIGSSQFCIESWIYLDSLPASGSLYAILSKWGAIGSRSYIFQIQNNSGTMRFALSYSSDGSAATDLFQNAAITAGTWHHVAVTRDSSNNVRFFLDGVAQGSATTVSTTFNNNAQQVEIGRHGSAINLFSGYISNCRLVIGSAVYTSGFTPTGPLTAITNTSLLLNFTNAGIFDNTGKNNLETVGNAQIDTTTKKFGTGSLEFDGTGDWLLMPNNPDQQLGTGNFTIEFWVYLATGDTGSARGLVAKGTSTTGFLVSLDSSQKVVFTFATSTITSSGAITLDAWNHIAVVRSGTGSNQTKIYIGGTNDGTGTVSTDFNQTSVMYVGANRTGGDPMKGFIDDLRITKGVARYTANFTAPTKAFPDQ